jgi:hypothetical protein
MRQSRVVGARQTFTSRLHPIQSQVESLVLFVFLTQHLSSLVPKRKKENERQQNKELISNQQELVSN